MCFYVLVPFIWLLSPVRDRIIWLPGSAILFLTVTAAVSRMVTGSFYVFDDTYFYYWFPTQAPVMIVGLIFYFFRRLKIAKIEKYNAYRSLVQFVFGGLWSGNLFRDRIRCFTFCITDNLRALVCVPNN
jgi:peptidoglycan/LPS O-acetylase OafA/YrhL